MKSETASGRIKATHHHICSKVVVLSEKGGKEKCGRLRRRERKRKRERDKRTMCEKTGHPAHRTCLTPPALEHSRNGHSASTSLSKLNRTGRRSSDHQRFYGWKVRKSIARVFQGPLAHENNSSLSCIS